MTTQPTGMDRIVSCSARPVDRRDPQPTVLSTLHRCEQVAVASAPGDAQPNDLYCHWLPREHGGDCETHPLPERLALEWALAYARATGAVLVVIGERIDAGARTGKDRGDTIAEPHPGPRGFIGRIVRHGQILAGR